MAQVELVNNIVSAVISETRENTFDRMSVSERAEQLLALMDRKNSVSAFHDKPEIVRPETSIAQSSLFPAPFMSRRCIRN